MMKFDETLFSIFVRNVVYLCAIIIASGILTDTLLYAAGQQEMDRGHTHYDPNQDPTDEPFHHAERHEPENVHAQIHTPHYLSFWVQFIYWIFPVPLCLLACLVIPLPKTVRKHFDGVLSIILSKTLFVRIPYINRSILTIIIFVTGSAFSYMMYETTYFKGRENLALSYKEKQDIRTMRWRSERNFWIIFMAMVLWIMLHRFVSQMKENYRLEKELDQVRRELNQYTEEKKND
mmetsp:Transcript_8705/g.10808  ORF Transcript_8705/g.10808 Transcript_8705/m.10808 type:complete len:234 (+) Transcript_8705:3-704(+)